jgi:F-type H+-transporting ATPase subunit delta
VRDPGIARNYAEALFELGERAGTSEQYASLLDALAGAIGADDHIRQVLESPGVPTSVRLVVVRKALEGRTPVGFQRWVEAVIRHGRQGLLGMMSREYQALLDVKFNRVQAAITLARQADPELQAEIVARLTQALGKTVVPHFRENPALLGGVIVRVGDRVMDGSVRHRMAVLRRKMLGG